MSGEKRECFCPRAKHRHGTLAAYRSDRCRCLLCRSAHARAADAYRSGGDWREQYVNSVGSVRRLRALAAAGVTNRQIAERIGRSPDMVTYLRRGLHQNISWHLAESISTAYDALWDKAAGDSDSRRASTLAKRLGYDLPMSWDDDSIDDPEATPALEGEAAEGLDDLLVDLIVEGQTRIPKHSQCLERIEAIRRLAARGWNDTRIADRIRMSRTAVGKARERHNIPSGVPKSGSERSAA